MMVPAWSLYLQLVHAVGAQPSSPTPPLPLPTSPPPPLLPHPCPHFCCGRLHHRQHHHHPNANLDRCTLTPHSLPPSLDCVSIPVKWVWFAFDDLYLTWIRILCIAMHIFWSRCWGCLKLTGRVFIARMCMAPGATGSCDAFYYARVRCHGSK